MKVLTNNQYYSQIANVIREQNGTNNTYKPPQMVSALKDLFYEEVEGVPPIIFKGNGENLIDYRIDGASGGVGDLITDISDDNYGKYKVPVVVNGKNSLQNNATTQTKNGVTFTVNEDKSISCNGTASGNAFFKIGDIQLKKNSIMSGCPAGGDNNSYLMRLYNNGSVFKTDSGTGVLINSEVQNGYAEIRIAAGYTCDNLTFYPMIRLAEIEDNTYEPYIEETTNIYLDEPLCNVNNNIDYIDFSSQSKMKKTGIIEFLDSSNWLLEGEHNFYYDMIIETASPKSLVVSNKVPSLATSIAETIANQYPENVWISAGQRVNLWLADIDHTLTALQNWLSQEPLIVQYQLQNHSEISVNLPTIPTKRGTNVLSVDTTVQPSKVYVKSRKESSYETTMRENYEQELSDIESALQEV